LKEYTAVKIIRLRVRELLGGPVWETTPAYASGLGISLEPGDPLNRYGLTRPDRAV
jgi:hypothetical protein